MFIEFVAHDDDTNVLAAWEMTMPPRQGEKVILDIGGEDISYAVGLSEYIRFDSGQVGAITTVSVATDEQ